ncbi:DUF4376 domain-containing protein [Halomonas citrativorans]|uniref:DUF4376 domain-containing protein n=1 Tax=Halomonas citrativorans TaxID=2742612 RepID=A0ABR9FGL3_9GAMM|nr:DUF4376 domain-containing protein [Halomonas citrativorans]MBE0405289.1 DUF4376 domain-containing protein [Halomonas citrativorans]
MQYYYSASENGFFVDTVNGSPTLNVPDPDFKWPMIEVPDPDHQGEGAAPLIEVRDDSVEPPMIDVPNPDCTLPGDAVEISDEYHQKLLAGQGHKRITADESGYPVLTDPPPISLDGLAEQKRAEIDAARDAAFAAGLEYDFNGETDVVQTRPQDQVNLLGLRAKAEAAIDQGATDQVMKFRGENNVTHYLTPDEMYTLTNDALAHIEGIYDHSWERKDAIDVALEDDDREKIEQLFW